MKKNSGVLLLASAAFLLASPAMAIPVTWTMSGVTFDDGGSASGSFVYDADTDLISSWSLAIVAGSVSALPSFTYNSATSKYVNCTGSSPCFDTILPGAGVGTVFRQIGFTTSTPLTNAGGTANISLGFEQSCRIISFISITSWAASCPTSPDSDRATFSGLLTAGTSSGGGGGGSTSVPEPTTLALLGLGLAGLAAARRRRNV